jgi:hypothetical protein
MPMYLKRDSIRLLEASTDAISMAVLALGLPRQYEKRPDASENAIAIGLAGVAAELAMSSILVQVSGEKSIKLPSGYFKTGGMIYEEFRGLVNSQTPKMVFLTRGTEDIAKHIHDILDASIKLKLLIKLRAGGLHSGRGPSRDVCVVCVNNVIDFIRTLASSARIKPYAEALPRTIETVKSYDLIANDLLLKASDSTSIGDRTDAIVSIYMVLPDLPDKESEWFPAFERLCVSPKENDISFLLSTLERSKSASLFKVSPSKLGIPVSVKKDDPSALPIEPQYLRKSFTEIKDRFYADVGNANGRLSEGQFDLPPIESIYEIFALKFHALGITAGEEDKLLAVDTWPLVARSLSYTGTIGPYWLFVKFTSDIGQLESYLARLEKINGRVLKVGMHEFRTGVEKIRRNTALSGKEAFVNELLSSYDKAIEKRENLVQLSKRYIEKSKKLCDDANRDLNIISRNEDESVGNMLLKISAGNYKFECQEGLVYWARTLCEAATEYEDAQGILAILKNSSLQKVHTAARKALRLIDFMNFGPKVQ